MNDHVCCACASKWQSAAEAAEAKLAKQEIDISGYIGVIRQRLDQVHELQAAVKMLRAKNAKLVEALAGLAGAVRLEVNEKGGGGYILARLSDAEAALRDESEEKT